MTAAERLASRLAQALLLLSLTEEQLEQLTARNADLEPLVGRVADLEATLAQPDPAVDLA